MCRVFDITEIGITWKFTHLTYFSGSFERLKPTQVYIHGALSK